MIYWVSIKTKTGRSIPVVQVLWEHLDWVQFPAARHAVNYNPDWVQVTHHFLLKMCATPPRAVALRLLHSALVRMQAQRPDREERDKFN